MVDINNGVYELSQAGMGMGRHTYAVTTAERCLTNYDEIHWEWYVERADLRVPNMQQKTKAWSIAVVNGVNE